MMRTGSLSLRLTIRFPRSSLSSKSSHASRMILQWATLLQRTRAAPLIPEVITCSQVMVLPIPSSLILFPPPMNPKKRNLWCPQHQSSTPAVLALFLLLKLVEQRRLLFRSINGRKGWSKISTTCIELDPLMVPMTFQDWNSRLCSTWSWKMTQLWSIRSLCCQFWASKGSLRVAATCSIFKLREKSRSSMFNLLATRWTLKCRRQ